MSGPRVLTPDGRTGVAGEAARRRELAKRAPVEARLRRAKVLVVVGWIVALAGVVVYCAASFAAGSDADLGAVLVRGTIPAARAGLLVVAGGTLTWIVGSIAHLSASLDAEEDERGAGR